MGFIRRSVAGVVAMIAGRPAQLPEALTRRFPELERAHWRRGGLPPRVGGWFLRTRSAAGITLWRTVWLADGQEPEPALVLHEFRHVEQFQGTRAFPLRYLWESLTRGYRRNRYEVDARQYAARRLGELQERGSGGGGRAGVTALPQARHPGTHPGASAPNAPQDA